MTGSGAALMAECERRRMASRRRVFILDAMCEGRMKRGGDRPWEGAQWRGVAVVVRGGGAEWG
eukprot:scaffold1102_cov195-Alexandrium_tamarense.AAC.31